MANIYVGFHDQRSSSRILKPPGGGTSDIFGTEALKKEERSAPNTPTKDEVHVKKESSLEDKSDSSNVNNSIEEKSNSEEPNIENLSIKEENGETKDHINEIKAEAKPDTISSIIKQADIVQSPVSPVSETEKKTPQRVPPGGYSSGLW